MVLASQQWNLFTLQGRTFPRHTFFDFLSGFIFADLPIFKDADVWGKNSELQATIDSIKEFEYFSQIYIHSWSLNYLLQD